MIDGRRIAQRAGSVCCAISDHAGMEGRMQPPERFDGWLVLAVLGGALLSQWVWHFMRP